MLLALLLIFIPWKLKAETLPTQSVILITLDGIEKSSVFKMRSAIQLVAQRGFSFGFETTQMNVSNNSSISLPGYRALLSGVYEKKCRTNSCAPIERETIFDQLPLLGIKKDEAVVFASWAKIKNAISQNAENYCGSIEFEQLKFCTENNDLKESLMTVLHTANTDRPILWQNSRKDKYTWKMAEMYLKQERPRLTYLSFVETDEWAHRSQFKKMDSAINEFNDRFNDLIALLKSSKDRYENTSIIITTDHGRGRGILRASHNRSLPNSKNIFAFVIPSINFLKSMRLKKTAPQNGKSYQQIQIKPTIEFLLNPSNLVPNSLVFE